MGKGIKHLFTVRLYHFFRNQLYKFKQKKYYNKWQMSGCPAPPPHVVKQNTIKDYQRKYGCNILVETGTYKGDMIEAQKKNFKKIFSIELAPDLHKKAKKRFANDNKVMLLQGDSSVVLSKYETIRMETTSLSIFEEL